MSSLVFVFLAVGSAAEPTPSDWRAQAAAHGFDETQIQTLERNGLLLVDESLRQVYQMYAQHRRLPGQQPPHDDREIGFLITTDAMIAAAHSCVDEALFVDEARQALVIRKWLQGLWDGFATSAITAQPDEEALLARGREFAQLFVGVPLRMLGGRTAGISDVLSRRIDDEIAHIENPPAFGGSTSPVLSEYGRMQPPAMYRVSALMSGFFRTRQWLASVAFDLSKDHRAVGYLLLSEIDERRDPDSRVAFRSISEGFFNEQGSWHNLSFRPGASVVSLRKNSLQATLRAFRDAARKRRDEQNGDKATSQHRAAARGDTAASESQIVLRVHQEQPLIPERIVSAARSAIAADLLVGGDNMSLAIAAWLKAPSARNHFPVEQLTALDNSTKDLTRFGTGGAYVHTLRALSEPADAHAPALFRSSAWKLKSIQTALAGWAHLSADRPFHTRIACCSSSSSAGSVAAIEPLPEFWTRMADYLERLPDPEVSDPAAVAISYAAEARWWAAQLRNLGTAEPPELLHDEIQILCAWCLDENLRPDLMQKPPLVPSAPTAQQTNAATDSEGEEAFAFSRSYVEQLRIRAYAPLIAALLDSAMRWEDQGDASPREPPLGKLLWRGRGRMRQLALDCRHLDALCQKQLRGIPFTEDDTDFLKSFSEQTSRYSFDYNSGWSGSRVENFGIRVLAVPVEPDAPVFHAATGRPMALYVLYPVNGTTQLLRGAVLTYHCFGRPAPLTAEEWRAELELNPALGRPRWLQPLYVRSESAH